MILHWSNLHKCHCSCKIDIYVLFRSNCSSIVDQTRHMFSKTNELLKLSENIYSTIGKIVGCKLIVQLKTKRTFVTKTNKFFLHLSDWRSIVLYGKSIFAQHRHHLYHLFFLYVRIHIYIHPTCNMKRDILVLFFFLWWRLNTLLWRRTALLFDGKIRRKPQIWRDARINFLMGRNIICYFSIYFKLQSVCVNLNLNIVAHFGGTWFIIYKIHNRNKLCLYWFKNWTLCHPVINYLQNPLLQQIAFDHISDSEKMFSQKTVCVVTVKYWKKLSLKWKNMFPISQKLPFLHNYLRITDMDVENARV